LQSECDQLKETLSTTTKAIETQLVPFVLRLDGAVRRKSRWQRALGL